MKAMRIFLGAGTAMGLVVGAPVFAAEEAAPDGVAAEGDIIVTAQRRAESMNDIGMAIQAVDAETLESLRVTDMRDLTTVAPSFTVSQSYQGVPCCSTGVRRPRPTASSWPMTASSIR